MSKVICIQNGRYLSGRLVGASENLENGRYLSGRPVGVLDNSSGQEGETRNEKQTTRTRKIASGALAAPVCNNQN